jgi:hypothetical protein
VGNLDHWKGALASMQQVREMQDQAPVPPVPEAPVRPLAFPPGMAGEIARYIHDTAIRPVPEVAIVGALGLLAGICGLRWQLPKSGLNLYLILVARSAVGKEAMHEGISSLINACARDIPTARKFVDFSDYASGPALIKGCFSNRCFVNVSGELGRRFKRLALEEGKDGPLGTWRTQLTNLYQKSTPKSMVGGINYSNTDNNVESIDGASYSLIGETTPGTFLESITDSMMEDGFMSRFTVIEYEGERPPENETAMVTMPPLPHVTNLLKALITQSDLLAAKNEDIKVLRSESADAKSKAFNLECDGRINGETREARRQMWNRAALKAQRIAALLAVADNHLFPSINDDHIDWAIALVRRDIATFTKRLDGGDVGDSDDARLSKLVLILKAYLLTKVSESYKVPDSMRQNSIVPRNYIQITTSKYAAFYKHKLGATRAMEETINSMIGNGYLMEVAKDKVVDAYGFHGKAYRVLRLPEL